MLNLIQDGYNLEYTNPGPDVIKGGDIIPLVNIVGIAATDLKTGETGAALVHGVYSVPKLAEAFVQGDKVYVDYTTKKATKTVSTGTGTVYAHVPLGIVWEAAAAGDTEAAVSINFV
jgi:predicted RecA/RadA family phage recombinase